MGNLDRGSMHSPKSEFAPTPSHFLWRLPRISINQKCTISALNLIKYHIYTHIHRLLDARAPSWHSHSMKKLAYLFIHFIEVYADNCSSNKWSATWKEAKMYVFYIYNIYTHIHNSKKCIWLTFCVIPGEIVKSCSRHLKKHQSR